jgi:5'-nucleotidase
MLILLTNDDGISAPGLIALYHELTRLGEVHVVAPSTVQSATGHGITLSAPLLTERVTVPGAFTGVAVDGRPADCVKLAISQFLPRRPDLVVSGMNSGANVGINVIYSGTVAAAIEGAFLGVPSIAVSLHLLKDAPPDYARSAGFAMWAIEKIVSAGLQGGQVVTINVPGLKGDDAPRGIKVVRQCTRAWNDAYERRKTPRGNDYFWNTNVFTLGPTEDDTDVSALREKYVTITPLQFDLTHHKLLAEWSRRNWND